jgi:hypothetical protein
MRDVEGWRHLPPSGVDVPLWTSSELALTPLVTRRDDMLSMYPSTPLTWAF